MPTVHAKGVSSSLVPVLRTYYPKWPIRLLVAWESSSLAPEPLAKLVSGDRLPDFYRIFSHPCDMDTLHDLKNLTPPTVDVLPAMLSGGYPEPFLTNKPAAYTIWMDNYFKTYITRDVRHLFPRLDMVKYRRFVSMLSGLSGTILALRTTAMTA